MIMVSHEDASVVWPLMCHDRWMREECEPGLASSLVPAYNRAHLHPSPWNRIKHRTYSQLGRAQGFCTLLRL